MGEQAMAIRNPFKADKATKLPTAENAPDWHKHPDLLNHRAQLEGARAKLPTLARTLEIMEQRFQEAQDEYDRCEMLVAAGKPLPEGFASLDDARQARDKAKQAYAVARYAHADVAKEHADLEATAQDVEETARAQIARQMSDEFMQLLDAQKATLEAAIEAQDGAQAYLARIQQAFPGYIAADYAFEGLLGVSIWPLRDLHKPTPQAPGGAYVRWMDRYEQIKATREGFTRPIKPENRMEPPAK